MPGILAALDAIDTSKLTLHVRAANGTVSASGTAAVARLDPRDLLGDLGALMKSGPAADPQALAKSVLGELGDVAKLLRLPAAERVSDAAASFDRLADFLRETLDQLGGDPAALIDRLLGEAGGLEKFTRDFTNRILDAIPVTLPGELTSGFDAISAVTRAPADALTLAKALSRVVIGFDLSDLQAPERHLEGVRARVASAGGDLGSIGVEFGNLAARVRAVSEMLLEPAPDVPAVLTALGGVKGRLDLFLNSTLAGAVARLTTDLAAIDPAAMGSKLRDLLVPFETRLSGAVFDIEQEMVAPLRGLAAFVDALTPEALTASFDAFADRLRATIANVGIDDYFNSIDSIFELLVTEMERVPLRKLRLELLGALDGIESRVRSLPDFSAPRALVDQIRAIEAAVEKVDTASVTRKVDEFAATLTNALSAFPINEIKAELEGVIDAVRDALAQIKPVLHDLEAQISDITARAEGLDFSGAGQASVDLMKGVRANVEKAVGSGDLPGPARAAIGVAAGALKGLDVSVEVSKPFDEALAGLDATAVLAPIRPVMERLRTVVHGVTPRALVGQLDGPFESLLSSLARLKPAALLAGLSQDYQGFVGRVGAADPRVLVAPLEAEFQKVVKVFRDAADPAPLFAPLRKGYRELQELLDLLDLENLFGKVFDKLTELPKVMQTSMQAAVSQKVAGAAEVALPPARDLKFGDVIRPVSAVVNRVRSAVTRQAEHVIEDALGAIEGPLGSLRTLMEGGGAALGTVTAALDARMRQVDLFAEGGPALELRIALRQLATVSASLDGSLRASVGPAVASVQLEAHFPAIAGPVASLSATARWFGSGLHTPDLVAALDSLSERFALPDPVPAGTVAARIDALFAPFNLEPLAQEMDRIGETIQAKFASLIDQVAAGVAKVWTLLVDFVGQIMPVGLVERLRAGMATVRAEFALLDPAAIEAEAGEILDAVVAVLDRFSPKHLAERFGGIFDAAKSKLDALNPAVLLANLDPIAAVIAQFEGLRPSVVLKPLTDSTGDLTASLDELLALDPGKVLVEASAKLKAQLAVTIEDLEAELRALLDYLEGLAGGGTSVSATATVG